MDISFFAEVNSFQFLAENHGTMVLIKVLSVLIAHWTVLHMELEFAPLLLVIIIFICHFIVGYSPHACSFEFRTHVFNLCPKHPKTLGHVVQNKTGCPYTTISTACSHMPLHVSACI